MKITTILKIGGGVILSCLFVLLIKAYSDNAQNYRSMTEAEHVCQFLERRNAGWDDAVKIVVILQDGVEEFNCE